MAFKIRLTGYLTRLILGGQTELVESLDGRYRLRIYGATGALHLLPDGRIEREQIWARIRNGMAQPLPTVVAETYIE